MTQPFPVAPWLASLVALCSGPAGAQQATEAPRTAVLQGKRPQIQVFRYEEDWRPLANPALRTEPLDALKFNRVGDDGWLTIGGEQRLRHEGYGNPRFGLGGPGGAPPALHDSYLLSRTLLHLDLNLTPTFRAFAQIGAFSVSGAEVRPTPLNDNPLDLVQAFVEATPRLGDTPVLIRIGRQEMGYGSQRLEARLSFDGVRIGATLGKVRIDTFAMRPVVPDFGSFNDSSSRGSTLNGVYATAPVGALAGLKADAYYLELTRPALRFTQVAGDERRQTVGIRLSGASGDWDWDIETAYQYGTLGGTQISAWTVTNEVGYRLKGIGWSPRIFLRADIASGDRDPEDGTLGTFEAPFPKISYLTEAGTLFTPRNLMDIHPGVSIKPGAYLTLSAEYAAVWKHRSADAFYLPPGVPVAGTQRGSRFAVQLAQLGATWLVTPQLTLSGAYVYASAEQVIKDGGGRSTDFLMLSATARF